jgi:hypothetical protein
MKTQPINADKKTQRMETQSKILTQLLGLEQNIVLLIYLADTDIAISVSENNISVFVILLSKLATWIFCCNIYVLNRHVEPIFFD